MFRYLNKISIGIGTVGVIYAYYGFDERSKVKAESCGCNPKWNYNWDRKSYKTGINDCTEPKATRHLILIRHGHYNTCAKWDTSKTLTKLGKDQAAFTGARLKELGLSYSNIVHSTMTRAIQTARIISNYIPYVPVEECMLLEEGIPTPPDPPFDPRKFGYFCKKEGQRIEDAFRKYFYRADPQDKEDSYVIIVCHANVIRYFVCRALQYPAEGWLRMNVKHASITWLSILPTGLVVLNCFGDAGYMPPEALTLV